MKNVLLFFALCFTMAVGAQEVQETTASISLGNKSAYMVEVEGADQKMAEKILKDFLKDECDTKAKKNKKADEWYAEAAKISGVNKGAPIDLYIKIEEGKGQSTTYFFADRGDAFISTNNTPDDGADMMRAVQEYGFALKKMVVDEELKEQEKMLKGLEKDLEKLQKQNDGYHDDIKKAEDKILEAKDNIEKNIKDQEGKTSEIEQKMKDVEAVREKYNSIGKKM